MSKYPDIDDPGFYKSINKKFHKYKIPENKKKIEEICFPKKYEFQIPQEFLSEFINPKTPYTGILVYHRIGAGKTCTAIKIAENFKKQRKILIVLPASLKGNFRTELRSPCAGDNYLTAAQRETLKRYHPSSEKYHDVIKDSDRKIDKFYTIYSYNKFIDLIKQNNMDLDNCLLIIDEVHNMVSESGTYYDLLYKQIHRSPRNLRLVIMTATPIFDKPAEIALTMNLLMRDKQLPTGQDFIRQFMTITRTKKGLVYKTKNMDAFRNIIKGYVSYYRGAPPTVFPKEELFLVKARMSDMQVDLYRDVLKREMKRTRLNDYVNDDISNSFFIGTRIISNMVFPGGLIGEQGYNNLEESDLDIANLKYYSPKFVKILKKIKKADGTIFVYSNFKGYGGIKSFARILEHHNFKNYEDHEHGPNRFAIWSGDQSPAYKEQVKAVFNDKNNSDGSQIKVILGSPSAKEGISFLRVQEVHIIEPYWNFSRMDQVIGRAIRFCSHKDVEKARRKVDVYIYMAVHPSLKEMAVDIRIMKMALDKKRINMDFERALKEAAVDCELFKKANVYPGEDAIHCTI